MKKIIRLTEQDLTTLLKGIVNLATGMATSNTNKKETTSNDKSTKTTSTNTTPTNTTSTNSDSKETKSTGKKLPPNIQKLIDKLKTSYVINITQQHIDKEYEQEGDIRLDAGGVNSEALKQIKKLIEDCKKANPKVRFPKGIVSDYRSYNTQVDNFGTKAKTRGIDDAQAYNTLPGFSQHHTGKAFDIFSTDTNWWSTNSGVKNWVANNCGKYGFDVTYKTKGKVRQAEPWHLFFKGGQTK